MPGKPWGTFKWGDGTKWGASAASGLLRWGVEVDWNGDGLFDGSNEARYMIGIERHRGRTSYVQQAGNGFETIQPGYVIITLDNATGRFDAWNTSSPLYPNVGYGKDVRITIKNQVTGIKRDYFYGVITDITPTDYGTEPQVRIKIEDGMRFLLSYSARVALQQNIAPDAAIALVLQSVNWPSRWGQDLDVSPDLIKYFWASGNKSASSVLNDLTQSFLGYFFVAANGKARFIQRQNVSGAGISLDQSYFLKDIGNPQPYVNFRNVIRLKAHPRTQAATGVIYQLLGNAPSIQPGASVPLQMFANYSYNGAACPAVNVITPVAGLANDWATNTAADGGGTDKTANCTLTMSDFGDTAKLVITNNSGTVVYLVKLQIRGASIYEAASGSDLTYPDDVTTVLGPREFVADLIWQQDLNVAHDFTALMGAHFGSLLKTPIIQLESRPDVQFSVDLFDILTASIQKIGIPPSSFRVAGISDRSLTPNCQALVSKWYLEPYISADMYMQWTTNAIWDTTTIFGA